ncbi:MAG TPA: hypothetical protein VHS33_12295 [Sphingomicrobium sp.]|jgi:hypothetical protein|nr:hypothetical protein [Sphingomicrobium sp.]
MRVKNLVSRAWPVVAAILVSGCNTIPGEPEHIIGLWGGPHVGLDVQGGLADVQFDCASGTIDDPLYPAADGSFAVKGTYRTGAPGPVKVGEYFKSQSATYSGQITQAASKTGPRLMTFRVALEDGTILGPFSLRQGAPPQLTGCA